MLVQDRPKSHGPLLSILKEIFFSFQASEELEDRQSLAVMAASGQDEVTGPDGETFIEKYTRGVSAVETILTLDRFVFNTQYMTNLSIVYPVKMEYG
jgi:hypothetical protein